MNVVQGLNLLVRFLLELSMLVSVGYWGFKTHSSWTMKILLGIGLPVLIATLWGIFMAPRSAHRLSGVPFTIMGFILLGSGAAALYASGHAGLAGMVLAVLIVSETLRLVWKQ